MTNCKFQEAWFDKAPGRGRNESEKDYYLLSLLYENITQDKEMIRKLFELSPYFKSKDEYHILKWTKQNFRYYEYVYEHLGKKF